MVNDLLLVGRLQDRKCIGEGPRGHEDSFSANEKSHEIVEQLQEDTGKDKGEFLEEHSLIA